MEKFRCSHDSAGRESVMKRKELYMKMDHLDKIPMPTGWEARIESIYEQGARKRSRVRRWQYAAAACMTIFLSGFAFPGYTQNLPVYSKIFALFEKQNYQASSEMMVMERESGGIKITMVDILFTDNRLSYSYIIESEEFLGEEIDLIGRLSAEDGNEIEGFAGESHIKYQGDNTYIGYDDFALNFAGGKRPEELSFRYDIREIRGLDKKLTVEDLADYKGEYDRLYPGEWNFAGKVRRIQQSVSRPQALSEKDGLIARLDRIAVDSTGTKMQIRTTETGGWPNSIYEAEKVLLGNSAGEEMEAVLRGSTSKGVEETIFCETEKLKKGESYLLSVDFVKQENVGYDEKGRMQKVDAYGSKAYEEAPDRITIELKFEMN